MNLHKSIEIHRSPIREDQDLVQFVDQNLHKPIEIHRRIGKITYPSNGPSGSISCVVAPLGLCGLGRCRGTPRLNTTRRRMARAAAITTAAEISSRKAPANELHDIDISVAKWSNYMTL